MALQNYPVQKKSNKKKIFLIVVAIVMALLAGLIGADRLGYINLPLVPDKNSNDKGTDDINYGPPTEEEKNETEKFKEGLGTQNTNQQTTTPAGQKMNVTPVISSWGQSTSTQNAEVSGYVNGVIEEGGTCTASLEKDGQTVTGTRTAIPNAQNASCGFISIERTKLTPGSWKVTLSYSSNTSQGTSQPVTLDVK